MTSIRFSFCGGESVMPHYIWQSNLLLIISVERAKKENATPPLSPQSPRGVAFSFITVRCLFVSFSFGFAKASTNEQYLRV